MICLRRRGEATCWRRSGGTLAGHYRPTTANFRQHESEACSSENPMPVGFFLLRGVASCWKAPLSASAVHPCFRHMQSQVRPRLFWSSHSTMYRSVNICVFDAISCGSILPLALIFSSSADPATRAPHAAQPLTLSCEIAPVPAMTPQAGPLTLRIRADQLRHCTTVHLLSILLAAQPATLTMASSRKPVGHPPGPPRQQEYPAGFDCLAHLSTGKTVPLCCGDEPIQPRCKLDKIQATVTKQGGRLHSAPRRGREKSIGLRPDCPDLPWRAESRFLGWGRPAGTPLHAGPQKLGPVADAGVDRHSESQEGTPRQRSFPALVELGLEVADHLADRGVAFGVQELFAPPLLVSGNDARRRHVAGHPLHSVGEVERCVELLERRVGHVPATI